MWKIFSWIAVGLTAVAAYFGMNNASKIKEERQLLAISQENVTAAKAKAAEWAKSLSDHKALKKKTEEEATEFDRLAASTKAKVEELAKEVDTKKAELQELTTKVADAKKKLDDLGGIDQLVTKVKELKQQHGDVDSALAVLKTQVATNTQRKSDTDKAISELRKKESWIAKGWLPQSFSSRLSAVDNTWGFVVIGSGTNSGITSGATLDVKRGGSVVGKVKVTNVEPNRAVGDIVKEASSDLAPGDAVVVNEESNGDLQQRKADADAAKVSSAPATATPAAAAGSSSPAAAPAAPAAPDPFAPAADAPPPPPAPDATAPAADAPAAETPATSTPDPFGK